LSRLLSRPAVREAPATLAPPGPSIDPVLRALIDRAAAEAYERGRAEGRREGLQAGRTEAEAAVAGRVEQLRAVLVPALDLVAAEARLAREERARVVAELAAAAAEAVLGREPREGGQALLVRVRDALAALDDAALVVRASPDDAELLRRGLADVGGAVVEVDESLPAGDARILGGWARAELTRAAAWAAVREVLDGDA
jgi:flagellar biosynthesis/type III secretory pathway protein FliH